jgi:peptide/nickel transport system substrate-binding protein
MTRRMVLMAMLVLALLTSSVDVWAQQPKPGGVFRIGVPDPPALDPHLVVNFLPQTVASLAYGHLLRFPAGPEQTSPTDFRILPDLAEKWEYKDSTTLVFSLRKGVRFHKKPPVNGREVVADDVKYSLERFRAKSPIRARFDPVQSIDVVDRYTVRIVLKEPFAPFLNHLASAAHTAILPREAEERFKDFNSPEAVIGTGPFVLKSYERGVRIVFERNPDYYMPGLPYLDGVTFEIVPDQAARLALLRTNKIELAHWWGFLSPEDGKALKRTNPEMVVSPHMIADVGHIFMRTDQPPFNDVRVRRAVSLAIDRKSWNDALLYGEGCIDSGPVPCAMTEWKLDAAKLDATQRKYMIGYDPTEAKRLLADAGFPRGFTAPLFHWPGFPPPWRSYYDLTADMLGKVGVAVELKPEELAKYSTTTGLGKFEKMAMGPYGAGVTEVDDFLYGMFYPEAPWNRSHVNDAELNKLLLAQRREMDPKKRRDIVYEIQRHLADKAYYISVPMYPRYISHPPYVKGFKHHDGYDLGRRLTFTWIDRSP